MLLRQLSTGSYERLRLDCGGPVIGLLPKACYEKGSLLLRPGDLLIAYTNGISEAMNSNQQEWGEDPMIVAAEQWADESAEGILKAIFGQPTVLSVAHRSTTT